MPKPDGLTTELATFAARRSRSEYVARRFAPYLAQSVLDVGCYEAPLRELLKDARYVGIDIVGKPDVVVNLDTPAPLPFGDRSFETVLCI